MTAGRRLALACALLASASACKKSEPSAATPGGSNAGGSNAGSATVGAGANTATPSPIPAGTRQLVTAIVPDWHATTAELQLWTRDGDIWRASGPAWRGVIGKTGAAWGRGLHGDGAPAGHDGPRKREGDGKSPAGVFSLAGTFGYAAAPPEGARLPYTQTTATWKCVDDPRSPHYNRIVDARATTIDWTSAEDMRRSDGLYTWVVEVAHNASATPGDGSCIFLHVWGGPDHPTVGCTAMPEDKLAALLQALSPTDAPAFVLLPRAAYDALAPAWHLP